MLYLHLILGVAMDNTGKRTPQKNHDNILEVKGRFKIIDKIPDGSTKFSIEHLRKLGAKNKEDMRSTSWTERTASTSTNNSLEK